MAYFMATVKIIKSKQSPDELIQLAKNAEYTCADWFGIVILISKTFCKFLRFLTLIKYFMRRFILKYSF